MENLGNTKNLMDYYGFLLDNFGADIIKLSEDSPHLFL